MIKYACGKTRLWAYSSSLSEGDDKRFLGIGYTKS